MMDGSFSQDNAGSLFYPQFAFVEVNRKTIMPEALKDIIDHATMFEEAEDGIWVESDNILYFIRD